LPNYEVEALGGTVWRVKHDSDSLVGYAYATYDVVPGEGGDGMIRLVRAVRPGAP
jgi:hypothetical protein